MRFPILYGVRPLEDDEVDRSEVYAWQHVQLTDTNRSRTSPELLRKSFALHAVSGFQGRIPEQSGDDGGGDPPVPIPNTEVKPSSADGTWGAGPWESRTLPGDICQPPDPTGSGGCCLYRHEILSPPARAGEGRISAVNCRQMAGGPNVEAIT